MPRSRRRFLPVVGLALLFSTVSCNVTETYPVGSVSAEVLNQNNAGVQGVRLDLYRVEGDASIPWRETVTNSNGIGVFGERDGGVIEGDYFIRLILSPTMELAPGEFNDRSVLIREGDNTTVTFRVVPRGSGS